MSKELPTAATYGRLDRWLHWLALQSQPVRELCFDLERALAGRLPPGAADGSVYVCGLARSGTTLLLQCLAGSTQFRSLTYRDMPFVLAPDLWHRVSRFGSRRNVAQERAHGDGVMVDYDSPEAFEEVFWRTFAGAGARAEGCYGDRSADERCWQLFREYRALAANPRSAGGPRRRYLSKNNNNLLRLPRLGADTSGFVVLAYRDPVATARSLLRMHRRFCETADPFTRRYMDWLGHHEFGPGHLPFCFARPGMTKGLSPDRPDYWLDYWTAVHRSLMAWLDTPRLRLVEHDALRRRPLPQLTALFAWLGLPEPAADAAAAIRAAPEGSPGPAEFDAAIVDAAMETYALLRNHPANLGREAATTS